MTLHDYFEWDPGKAVKNRKKHQVTFEDAAEVLRDEAGDVFHVEEYDDAHSFGEDRQITTCSHPVDRTIILRICWTERWSSNRRTTRIISARLATPREREFYAKEIGDRLAGR